MILYLRFDAEESFHPCSIWGKSRLSIYYIWVSLWFSRSTMRKHWWLTLTVVLKRLCGDGKAMLGIMNSSINSVTGCFYIRNFIRSMSYRHRGWWTVDPFPVDDWLNECQTKALGKKTSSQGYIFISRVGTRTQAFWRVVWTSSTVLSYVVECFICSIRDLLDICECH